MGVLRQKKAFTLIELLLAVFILAFGIASILQLFSQSILSSNAAWDLTVASSHAETLLEEMQSRETLDSIISENWDQWGRANDLNQLPDEQIQIKMNDHQMDPLPINVIISWDRSGRKQSVQFQSRFTK